jgi:hypothetical protein
MRRFLNPTVALITFLIGVLAASLGLAIRQQGFEQPEVSPVALPSASIPLRNDPEDEKYAVYSALIRDMYVAEGTNLLVIGQETGCLRPSDDVRTEELRGLMEECVTRELCEVTPAVIDNFRGNAMNCRLLDRRLDIPVKYVLVSDRELESLFRKNEVGDAWERFYNKYPKSSGIISLSNVGFNPEMSQAFVATSRGCGGLCGAGYYVSLKKENGVWRVYSKTMTWIS